jgi:GNAT superfamily N-acetyltransferase
VADVTPERGLPREIVLGRAEEADAAAIAALQTAAARDLTERYGRGHWSYETSERSVLRSMATARVLVARLDGEIAGALTLQTKKPWAIDRAYFTGLPRALYLVDMAVQPNLQRRGIGRRLLDYAAEVAREWPAGAIRLDAYDADAGAGGFYGRCGYRECGRVVYRGTPLVYYELVLQP